MKHTPTEDKALKAAQSATEIPAEEYLAIRKIPEAQRTHAQRRARLEDHLKCAAAAFEQRERSNDLYRHFLKEGDRTEARYHAPSQLLDSMPSLRRRLTEAWKDLAEFDRMPLARNVQTDTKRWLKTKRFFAALELQKAIERNGGKVRYRQTMTHAREKAYALIRAANPEKEKKPQAEPMQLALGV